MLGVVLCGGRSMRFPHKLYLSSKKGICLPMEAVQMLKSVGLTQIKVCVNSQDNYFHSLFKYMKSVSLERDNYDGLPRLLERLSSLDDLIVICGDNVYGLTTMIETYKLLSQKSKRVMLAVNRTKECNSELHGWSCKNDRWAEKGGDDVAYPLTTPWCIPKGTSFSDSLIETFNSCKAAPVAIDDPEWSDLGTEQSVKEYYGYK